VAVGVSVEYSLYTRMSAAEIPTDASCSTVNNHAMKCFKLNTKTRRDFVFVCCNIGVTGGRAG
jgi:hypothetical protein